MKKAAKIISIFLALFLTTTLYAQTKRYEIKSGIVEYKIEGGGSIFGFATKTTGTAKLYFKEWGNVELRQSDEKNIAMGKTTIKHDLTKIDHGTIYTVEDEDKIIIKSDIDMLKQMDKKGKNISAMGKDMMKQMGGKKIGNGKILGYNCEIWEMMGSKIWIYKGVALKTEANIMGFKHLEVATSAKFNTSIPEKIFNLPNYPIKTINDMIKENASPKQPTPQQMEQMQKMMENLGNMFNQKK